MNIDELRKELSGLSTQMDAVSDAVNDAAKEAQEQIYQALVKQLGYFDTSGGRFVSNQDLSERIAIIQRRIDSIINKVYKPSLKPYFREFSTIDETTSYLHKSYNELLIEKAIYDSAKRAIYDQTEYWLINGVADAYVQPTKYMLMQAISSGITIKQGESLLRNWNNGELKSGSVLAVSRPTPRLQAYAGQIAKDGIFQYHGTIQDKIGEEYGLNEWGVYVGGILEDSRPGCIYLVGLRRKINIKEIPAVIDKYPQGVIPGTTMKNFPIRRLGYRCNHSWMWVKG